ncbi:MAG TPA: hypothetical protein VH834_25195 [Solirubrobacteraceae bacterium]
MRSRRRRAILAVVLAAIVLAAVVVLVRAITTQPGAPAPPRGEAPPRASAERFLDSVGVNVHVTYLDTAYGHIDDWLARLRELGVRHVRDGIGLGNAASLPQLGKVAAAGMRLTLITSLDRPADQQLASVRPLGPAVEAVEAPNETDVAGPSDWAARLQRFMPSLRAAVDAQGSPKPTIIGPSFVQPESWKQVAAVADSWDVTNLHPYPGGQEPFANLDQELARAREQGHDGPIMATETGYHNALRATSGQPPVSEQAVAAYLPRLLMGYFAAGIERTFLYELADEKPDAGLAQAEQHFGLLHADLTPKPAFAAVRDLLQTVRRSDGPGQARQLRVQAPRDVKSLLLERRDGSSVLALWRPTSVWNVDGRSASAVRPVSATLRFGSPARDVVVSSPGAQSGRSERRDSAAQLSVPVAGDLVLVSYR